YFDATKEFPEEYKNKFDFVVTNPPFGTFPPMYFDKYEITSLEHYIVLKALETMKPTGKAAIIVGGNINYDKNGIITPGKFRQFLFYLYSRYNVVDVLNCSGDLYYKMGTSFPITIIFIKGITHNPKYPPRVDFDLSTGMTNSPNQIQHFEAIKSRVENLI
ncbi:MAG: N-6 DNA methylase, partial [Patescibacteria group bacterium]